MGSQGSPGVTSRCCLPASKLLWSQVNIMLTLTCLQGFFRYRKSLVSFLYG